MQAEGLAQTALDPVAHHRAADGSRNGEADARAQVLSLPIIAFARLAEGGEERTGDAKSVIIDMPEIGGA